MSVTRIKKRVGLSAMAMAMAMAMGAASAWAGPISASLAAKPNPIQAAKARALAMPAWQRRDRIMDCVKDFDGESYRFEMGAGCKGLWQASLESDFNGNYLDLDRWLKARAAVEAPVREGQREM